MQTKTKSFGYFFIFAVVTIVSLTVLLTLSALMPTTPAEAAGGQRISDVLTHDSDI